MVGDVRMFRPEPLGAFAIINDSSRPPNQEHLSALKAYEVVPLLWSHREEAVSVLNGG